MISHENRSSKKNDILRRYKYFYISQSTAFIAPILYIFLQSELNLSLQEILKISSFYLGFSILLQIPCGLIADRCGTKKNLFIYLIFQICSCLGLIVFNNHYAYHVYLISSILGQAFFGNSGAVLIKQYFGSRDEEFKKYSFELQNTFYKFTSIIIISASILYIFNMYIPFLLQIGYFLLSAYYLNLIPEEYLYLSKSNKNIFQCVKDDVFKSITFIFKEKVYLFLIICSILFGLGVSINQKTIQSQLFSLFEKHQIIYIGCVIAFGNLFSSIGASYLYNKFSNKLAASNEILVLMGIFIFSLLLMSFENIFFVVLGFMIINLFKGCYRPILSSDLINLFPFNSSMNTNFSIISSLSIILTSTTQYLLSFIYKTVEFGNIFFLFFSIIVFIAFYIFSKIPSYWQIKTPENILTKKMGVIERNKNTITMTQIYSSDFQEDRLIQIVNVMKLNIYPAKDTFLFINSNGDKGLKTEFLGEIHLSDVLDPNKQFRICQQLLKQPSDLYPEGLDALIAPEYYIFKPFLQELLKTEPMLSKKGMIHGDLHPENIMIVDERPYVIDWDQCGNGPFWYDLLSLLSHPYLHFDKQRRYSLFLNYCDHLNDQQLDALFSAFCQFKGNQLKKISTQDDKFLKLSQKYFNQKEMYLCH